MGGNFTSIGRLICSVADPVCNEFRIRIRFQDSNPDQKLVKKLLVWYYKN